MAFSSCQRCWPLGYRKRPTVYVFEDENYVSSRSVSYFGQWNTQGRSAAAWRTRHCRADCVNTTHKAEPSSLCAANQIAACAFTGLGLANLSVVCRNGLVCTPPCPILAIAPQSFTFLSLLLFLLVNFSQPTSLLVKQLILFYFSAWFSFFHAGISF